MKMTQQKAEFLTIGFQHNVTLTAFADRFKVEAHVLIGAGTLTKSDVCIDLISAVKPYRELINTMTPYLEVGIPLLNWFKSYASYPLPSLHTT